METKICSKCDEEKPVSEFYKNKKSSDGYAYHCKRCHSKINRTDESKVCKECGKEFHPLKQRVKKGWGIFCSCKCYHSYRKKHGNAKIKGKKHYNWKQGKVKDDDGYVKIYKPEHPGAIQGKYIYEHRLKMSEHLDRPLKEHENVHHKNGIRDDNRIENLELWTTSQPSGSRVEDKIQWAKDFLEDYGYKCKKDN